MWIIFSLFCVHNILAVMLNMDRQTRCSITNLHNYMDKMF